LNEYFQEKSKEKVLKFDIDGVIRDFVGSFYKTVFCIFPEHLPKERWAINLYNHKQIIKYLNTPKPMNFFRHDFIKHININPNPLGITEYGNMDKCFNMTRAEIDKIIYDDYPELVFNNLATPYDGAIEFLNKLDEQGYKIIFVSHQKPKSASATIDWLEQYNIKYEFFCYSKESDHKYLLGNYPLIDDKPSNLFYDYDILFERPWNKSSDWKNRVSSYNELFDKLILK
jgi:5'(3')-deoxyribonucleotidase